MRATDILRITVASAVCFLNHFITEALPVCDFVSDVYSGNLSIGIQLILDIYRVSCLFY